MDFKNIDELQDMITGIKQMNDFLEKYYPNSELTKICVETNNKWQANALEFFEKNVLQDLVKKQTFLEGGEKYFQKRAESFKEKSDCKKEDLLKSKEFFLDRAMNQVQELIEKLSKDIEGECKSSNSCEFCDSNLDDIEVNNIPLHNFLERSVQDYFNSDHTDKNVKAKLVNLDSDYHEIHVTVEIKVKPETKE